jgi:ribosomal protein L22
MRLIITIFFMLALVITGYFIIQYDGSITIKWSGIEISTSLIIFTLFIMLLCIFIVAMINSFFWFINTPKIIKQSLKIRELQTDEEKIANALCNIEFGNLDEAEKYLKNINSLKIISSLMLYIVKDKKKDYQKSIDILDNLASIKFIMPFALTRLLAIAIKNNNLESANYYLDEINKHNIKSPHIEELKSQHRLMK